MSRIQKYCTWKKNILHKLSQRQGYYLKHCWSVTNMAIICFWIEAVFMGCSSIIVTYCNRTFQSDWAGIQIGGVTKREYCDYVCMVGNGVHPGLVASHLQDTLQTTSLSFMEVYQYCRGLLPKNSNYSNVPTDLTRNFFYNANDWWEWWALTLNKWRKNSIRCGWWCCLEVKAVTFLMSGAIFDPFKYIFYRANHKKRQHRKHFWSHNRGSLSFASKETHF